MDKTEIHYAELPEIDCILDHKARTECADLMEELDATVTLIESMSLRVEEIKLRLEAFQYMVDGPGIRYGNLAYTCQTIQGKRTLNKDLLMGNGVSKGIIDLSYKMGEPSTRRTFKRLGREE